MNRKQKLQVTLAILFALLCLFWLFMPGWDYPKIIGILANAAGAASMIISYREEEKNKKG